MYADFFEKHSRLLLALFLVAMLTMTLLIPSIVLGQTGDLWFADPGLIGSDVTPTGEIRVWTTVVPERAEDFYQCKFEFVTKDGYGLHTETLSYIDCEDQDTFYFPFPMEYGEINIQKRVFWHNENGTRWATTDFVTLKKPVPVTQELNSNEGKRSKVSFGFNQNLNERGAVVIIWNSTKGLVGFHECKTEACDLNYILNILDRPRSFFTIIYPDNKQYTFAPQR